MLEPIRVKMALLFRPKGYLAGVSGLCRENKVLFIADEIQTGLCRDW